MIWLIQYESYLNILFSNRNRISLVHVNEPMRKLDGKIKNKKSKYVGYRYYFKDLYPNNFINFTKNTSWWKKFWQVFSKILKNGILGWVVEKRVGIAYPWLYFPKEISKIHQFIFLNLIEYSGSIILEHSISGLGYLELHLFRTSNRTCIILNSSIIWVQVWEVNSKSFPKPFLS